MKNKSLFINFLISLPFLFIINVNAQVHTYEIFPLNTHLKYSYDYYFSPGNTEWGTTFVIEIDTGIVDYFIYDSTISNDTVIWDIKQIKNLYIMNYARDTNYVIEDTSKIALFELTNGLHRLCCSSLVWNFSFNDSSEGIFRYGTNPQTVIANTWDSISSGGEDTLKLNDSLGLYYYESYSYLGNTLFGGSDVTIAKLLNLSLTSIKANRSKLSKFSLRQNYPNPFNPTTTIEYSIPIICHVNIEVYDLLGKRVATLVNDIKKEGNYNVKFDASLLSSGVYFYRIIAGNFVDTKKLILLK